MATVTTRPESREDALIRLADQARATGVKLYQDPRDNRYYASSRSRPGTLHRLTAWTCSCEGFIRHQRCAHLGALLAHLGWIDTTPEPTPAAPASCPICHGSGSECGTIASGRTWTYASVTCGTCHGRGVAEDAA